MLNRVLSVSTLFFLCILGLNAQKSVFPTNDWQTKMPAELGLKKNYIDSIVYIAQTKENKVDKDLRLANIKAYEREPNYRIHGPMKTRGATNGVIIKDGYLVASWGDPNRVDMTFSVTKSMLSTMAAFAFDQGLIRLDDKVSNTIWDGTFAGPHNEKITWRNLLDQSSDWSGCQYTICDWADRPPKDGTMDDWKARKLNEPGTVFEYNDVRVNLLAYCLTHLYRTSLAKMFHDKIMDPIGASRSWRWYGYDQAYENIDGTMTQIVSEGGHFGAGLFISASDMARFGLLFLNKGQWNGKRIFGEQWITEATKPSVANKDYGFLWWLNTSGSMKDLGNDFYYADGFGGNKIIIMPNQNMVIVTRWMDNEYLDDIIRYAQMAAK